MQRNKINNKIKIEKREKSLALNTSKQKLLDLIFSRSSQSNLFTINKKVISNNKLKDQG